MSGGDDRFDGLLGTLASQQSEGIEGLLDAFFGFLRRRTDFFTGASEETIKSTVWKKIAAHKKIADDHHVEEKRKRDQEAEIVAKRKALEEAAKQKAAEEAAKLKAAAEANKSKLEPTSVPTSDPAPTPASTVPSSAPTPSPASEGGESSSADQAPTPNNGGSGPGYTWSQSLREIEMEISLPRPTRGRDVTVVVKKHDISVAMKSGEVLVSGKLCKAADWDDITWTIVDQTVLHLVIPKENKMEWWNCVVIGHPTIDTQKVTPENSKLGDLDGETRATVEKMMYDQQRKAAGLPTSDEQKKQEMLQKFMAQHPEMDFSQAKIM